MYTSPWLMHWVLGSKRPGFLRRGHPGPGKTWMLFDFAMGESVSLCTHWQGAARRRIAKRGVMRRMADSLVGGEFVQIADQRSAGYLTSPVCASRTWVEEQSVAC